MAFATFLHSVRKVISDWVNPAEKPAAAAAAPAPANAIQGSGQRLRALSFAGGGADTVNQFGFTHALMVAKAQPPDLVAGISAGAVNAVMLAEILQAGQCSLARPDRAAQVTRFHEVFEAMRSFPDEFLRQLAPDPFEVDARAPLKPQSLPIHFQEERKERLFALNARYGLIRLLNSLLGVGLPVSTATRMVRRILHLKALAEEDNPERTLGRIWHLVMLWLTAGWNAWHLSPLFMRLILSPIFAPQYEALLRLTAKQESHQQRRSRVKGGLLFCVKELFRLWLRIWDFPAPSTAKEVLERRTESRVLDPIRYAIGIVVYFFAWALAGLPLTLVVGFSLYDRFFDPEETLWRNGVCAVLTGLALGLWWFFVRKARNPQSTLMERLFSGYDLAKDLCTPYAVKPFLVRHIDPDYYGKLDVDRVIESALARKAGPSAPTEEPRPKKLEGYAPATWPSGTAPKPKIHVRPIVADIATGKLRTVAPGANVVDALLAAGAVVPFFRPQKIPSQDHRRSAEEIIAIDGLNISNDPLLTVFSVLAELKKQDALSAGPDTEIEVYPVSGLPRTPPPLGQDEARKGDRVPLCDVVRRALELQRFRDAELGRRMVDLFHRVLPNAPFFELKRGAYTDPFVYVRATICAVQPEAMPNLNERVLEARSDGERRDLIAQGAADGCRATLEVILAKTIRAVAAEEGANATTVKCGKVIARHLGTSDRLPGAATGSDAPPGVPEVCRHCVRGRNTASAALQSLGVTSETDPTAIDKPDWPVWGKIAVETKKPAAAPASSAASTSTSTPAPKSARTAAAPTSTPEPASDKAPAISLLFSGGVFRGVFQVGVVAALEQVDARPNIMAGASIGSIMAAMSAEVFNARAAARRQRLVADIASSFLCVDRLVLTDRFSDFIRRITLRAAETEFSIRDADWFFRRFDAAGAAEFSNDARRVVAGLERLLYLSPFELKEIVKSIRASEHPETMRRVFAMLQNFLELSGVGQEVLGAEPLELLLKHHVLDRHKDRTPPHTFEWFWNDVAPDRLGGIHLLATTTNLTLGELTVLGQGRWAPGEVALSHGLFASSAFPGVFRPRWSWEVFPHARDTAQFVDGGVMDNLPIFAVIDFLAEARNKGLIRRQGAQATPHLLFTASLEPDPERLKPEEAEYAARFWARSQERAARLRYNKKISDFARAQVHFREILAERAKTESLDYHQMPLDIEVVCVKPKWLCGTFAFNPMLGFRRINQARSIAHGCAMTLAKLSLVPAAWRTQWGLKEEQLALEPDTVVAARGEIVSLEPQRGTRKKGGACWFRPGCKCPFSRESLMALPAEERPGADQLAELTLIYEQCGLREAHRGPVDGEE